MYLPFIATESHVTFQVPMVLPIIFFIICAFLVTFPCYVSPWEVGVGIIIILFGIPVYWIFIYWQSKPAWLVNGSRKSDFGNFELMPRCAVRMIYVMLSMCDFSSGNFNVMCARLFMCVEEDKTE